MTIDYLESEDGFCEIIMNAIELTTALRERRQIFGTLIVSQATRWPKAVSQLGLDFVFIDTEHTSIDRHELSCMCNTYEGIGLAPIVRISEPDAYEACRVLDGGAAGIIAPYVESVEEVRTLAGAVKYKPLKGEKLTRLLNGEDTISPASRAYLESKSSHALIVNIESEPAISRLDEILSVAELDGVVIGPHDLSINLGIPEDYGNPLFKQAVTKVIEKSKQYGKSAGIHFWGDIDLEIDWIKEGMNLIIHSSDLRSFAASIQSDLKRIHQKAQLSESAASGAIGGQKLDINI